MANDLEESFGPTVFDIICPSETICAYFSQGNTRQFGQNAGKQCVVMSLTVIIHTEVKTYYNMGFIILKYTILSVRNIRYTCIYNSIKNDFLLY